MKTRTISLILVVVVTLTGFAWFFRQLSFVSVGLAANSEVQRALRQSLSDQKSLARSDPSHAALYRQRFEDVRLLLTRMEILSLTGRKLTSALEGTLLALVALVIASGSIIYLIEHRRRERRLVQLRESLMALSRGEPVASPLRKRRDLIGRIGLMIESTSNAIDRDRRRMRSLEHLSSWQEAARRHAHEIRTPLTAARMEVARLLSWAGQQLPGEQAALASAQASIFEELERLRAFTTAFTSFAMLSPPRLVPLDLARFLEDFAGTFASAWPGLRLESQHGGERCEVMMDANLMRQLLVNLANNSAQACDGRTGLLRLRAWREGKQVLADVADDGPGISASVRERLFEPYTTTRQIGEGMGLGLSICKKIMLDHGGDLDLVSSERGATFRLTFPAGDELRG
ncbi:MAG TPA: ATP-binding protein [Thermoanaerobaculia bacterium]|nr:ATP-binding protein [Thermoanaerobaculia bacterium]